MGDFQPDWKQLNRQAAQYKASSPLVPQIDEVTSDESFVYTGLCVQLSEIMNHAGTGHFTSFVIAVDTLQVSGGTTRINAAAVEIVARSIQLSEPAEIVVAGEGLQITTSEINGQLSGKLAPPSENGTPAHEEELQVDPHTPVPQVLTMPTGTSPETTSDDQKKLADVLHSPWSILELELTLDAAASLVQQDGGLAAAMLRWVTAGVYALLKNISQYKNLDLENLTSLQSNAVSLLAFTQVAASGATYVPVLSSMTYKRQVNALLQLANTYSTEIGSYRSKQFTEGVAGDFASTLQSINSSSETPLINMLKLLGSRTGALETQLQNAAQQLYNVGKTLKNFQDDLEQAIKDESNAMLIKTALTTFFDVLTLYAGAGAAVTGDPEVLAGTASKQLSAALTVTASVLPAGVSNVNNTIAAGRRASTLGNYSSTSSATAKKGVQVMIGSVARLGEQLNSLWQEIYEAINRKKQGNADLSNFVSTTLYNKIAALPDLSNISTGGLDPVTYWKNMVIQVQTQVRPLQTGRTASAANAYLGAIELAASYGTSVGDLQSKLLELYTQGMSTFGRLWEVQEANQRWNALKSKLSSDQAKRDAAIGFLQRGYTNVKRNLVLAINNYRAAFYYQWLQESDVVVDPSMDYLELSEAVENSITSLEHVLQGTGNTLRPSQTATGLTYKIVRGANPLLTEVDNKGQAVWSIPLTDKTLSEQINGNTALYLTGVTFELEGAEQNQEVELEVETSGHYENKLGQRKFRFVTEPVSMDSDYSPSPPSYLVKWKFANPAAYLKPTPYTQWRLTVDKGNWKTASAIKMKLNGIYLQNPAED